VCSGFNKTRLTHLVDELRNVKREKGGNIIMERVALAFVLAVVASPLFAKEKLSGEILFGFADQKTEALGESVSADEPSKGLRLAYQFNQNFALELAYQNNGNARAIYLDADGNTIRDTIATTAVKYGVKGLLPLEQGHSIVARAGMAKWEYDLEETDSSLPGEVIKLDDEGTDLYYGIGIQRNINEDVFVGLEYMVTKMNMSFFGVVAAEHRVNNLSLSFGANF
jgi:hypothetical protein